MAKKRTRDTVDQAIEAHSDDEKDESSSSDDDDFDVVNVDFEWFNFDPEIDFQGVKTLLRQLFDVDSVLFDLSALTDLILQQHTIGSTVKVDEKANDAYAFLTVLNLAEHSDKKPIEDISRYVAGKAKTNDALATVSDLVSSGKHVGLILSERLVNMPSEIAPPMYTMLVDEIEAAVEDQEPYEFSHYLIMSKVYREVESTLDQDERKKKRAKEESEVCYFHPEDEIFLKYAAAHGSYHFTNEEESIADSKRAFQEMGVQSEGFMILIEANKFEDAVKAAVDYLSPSA